MGSFNAAQEPRFETIAAAQIITASAASPVFDIPNDAEEIVIIVQATAVSGTTPSAVATLQDTPDNGQTWIGTGNNTAALTAPGIRRLKFSRAMFAQAATEASGGTAAANAAGAATNGPVGRKCRLWVEVSGTTPSFTINAWRLTSSKAN